VNDTYGALLQASELADHLALGLVDAASIPALPARWLEGTTRLESPAAAEWFTPLGLPAVPEGEAHDVPVD
jgi:hypothetical protein